MQKYFASEEEATFDFLIPGTGLAGMYSYRFTLISPDCILASSLSCCGKRVLQVDANQFYGNSESSMSLGELVERTESTCLLRHSRTRDPSHSTTNTERIDSNSNFSIDVSVPFVFLGRSRSVDELVRHQVSKYLNFMSVKDLVVRGNSTGGHWTIPTDRSRIFSDKCLKLTEKRALMTLFKEAAQHQSSAVHSTALAGSANPHSIPNSGFPVSSSLSAISYLESHNISRPEIILGIIHGVCMYPSPAETMKTDSMLNKLRQFVSSLDAYEPGCPFLIPTYGNGDIPQSFARIAAVHGASQILGCPLETIKSELSEGQYVLIYGVGKANANPTQIIHAIVASRFRDNDPKNVSFEVIVDSISDYPIFCITIPHPDVGGDTRPGVCPPGTCLRHLVRIVSDEASDVQAMNRLISQVPDEFVLFKRIFREESFRRGVDNFFGLESYIDEATQIFNKVMDRDEAEPLPVPPPPINPFEDTVE